MINMKLKHLIEGNTFPEELYHITSHVAAAKMVKENKVKLTFASGWDLKLNRDKFFYFSMSYDKWGRYSGSNYRELSGKIYFTNTILVMDSRQLQHQGKLIPVDYWEHKKYHDDEKEIRFISDKQVIEAKRSIKEIHVFVPQKSSLTTDIKQESLRALLTLQESDFDVYFYDDPRAFKLTLKKKSSQTFSDMLDRSVKVRKSEKHGKRGSYNSVSHIIHLLQGTNPEVDRYKSLERLRDMIQRTYGSENYSFVDAVNTIDADIGNGKKSHDESYQELANLMRKLKLRTPQDIVKYVYNKFFEKKDISEQQLIGLKDLIRRNL
jgi:hypothetical protein